MKKMIALFGIIMLALGLTACGDKEEAAEAPAIDTESIPAIVATVNGEEIIKEHYVAMLEQQAGMLPLQGIDPGSDEANSYMEMVKEELINQMINERLLIQAANNEGIEISDADIDAEIESVSARFETKEKLEEALKEEGFTLEDLREDIVQFKKRDKYLDKKIKLTEITDEELQMAYDELIVSSESDDQPSFEEAKEQLLAKLTYEQQQVQMLELLEELRAESEITIHI
ncbi:hypothetical protein GN156_00170 [bacterium LRH843]|nr:hypothetical protein [bacterium LRH843]